MDPHAHEPDAADPVEGRPDAHAGQRGVSRRDIVIAGHTGDLDVVHSAIDHPDPAVRAAALGALDRLEALADDTVTDALVDPDVSVRRRAAELAARRPAVDLLGVLSDPDVTVVETAAFACGEREHVDDRVLERLIDLTTSDDDALVREAAAAALGAIGDPRGLPAILTACQDKPAVRRRAVLALAPFLASDGDDDDEYAMGAVPAGAVDAAVEAALVDRDWQVRQAAEDLRRATAD